jgi:cytochrome c oxidase assembly protein subunit 15
LAVDKKNLVIRPSVWAVAKRAFDFLTGASSIRFYVWASLISQILIVVTGGVVRLTGSGLGCPTWPKCTADSLVTVPAMGWHGIIEFANRLLTFALALIALGTFIAVVRLAKQQRVGLLLPALFLGLGIPAQAILGGITVLTQLNPWTVGGHFVLSGIMIWLATLLVWRFYEPKLLPVTATAYRLTAPLFSVGVIAVLIGVLVTGAGPHAGDANSVRNGLDLDLWQHFHSYPGYLMFAFTMATVISLIKTEKTPGFANWRMQTKITVLLLAVTLLQIIIGITQSRMGVPALLVGLHMLGASTLISILSFQWLSVRGKAKRG